MDLRKVIESLRREKEKLEKTIASLEELQRLRTMTLKAKARRKKFVTPRPPENLGKENG
jgi:hypothetical protein